MCVCAVHVLSCAKMVMEIRTLFRDRAGKGQRRVRTYARMVYVLACDLGNIRTYIATGQFCCYISFRHSELTDIQDILLILSIC